MRVERNYMNFFCTAEERAEHLKDPSIEPRFGAEVEKKPDLQIRRSEIIQQLSLGSRGQQSCGFDFQYQNIVDHQVRAIHRNATPLVVNRQCCLPPNRMTLRCQLDLQRRKVDILQESESESVINVKNDPITDSVSFSSNRGLLVIRPG